MTHKKGHTNNPNGRPKGKPNKVTGELKTWVHELIDGNRETIKTDLQAIEPAQRLAILEKLMSYCIPKQQAIDVKAQVNAEYEALEKLLRSAPDAAVQRIADKVMELQKVSNNNKKY